MSFSRKLPIFFYQLMLAPISSVVVANSDTKVLRNLGFSQAFATQCSIGALGKVYSISVGLSLALFDYLTDEGTCFRTQLSRGVACIMAILKVFNCHNGAQKGFPFNACVRTVGVQMTRTYAPKKVVPSNVFAHETAKIGFWLVRCSRFSSNIPRKSATSIRRW